MKKIRNWQIAGFVFTAIIGTFFHFLFDLTSESIIAALISPVNESIWEHTKLLFVPMFVFALLEYGFWGREYAFVMLCMIGIVFFVFTFYPPNIPLFEDPVSKTYGVKEKVNMKMELEDDR